MTTVNEISVTIQSHPTAFTQFLLRHWYVGSVIALFVRFIPVEWLVRMEVVEVTP